MTSFDLVGETAPRGCGRTAGDDSERDGTADAEGVGDHGRRQSPPRRIEADVVIVGGSVAGCTAAVLLARQGVSVVVLERAGDRKHYKRSCTHFIQQGAQPVIERLGITEGMVRAGARRTHTEVWTRWGWHENDDHVGWNLRRRALDPLMRELAEAEANVTYRPGVRVVEVARDDSGRPCGVRGRTPGGMLVDVAARLVVAADGRSSDVAGLCNVVEHTAPHARILYFGYFAGVNGAAGPRSALWLRDPDVNYVFATDAGLSVVGCMVHPDHLADFRANPQAALLRTFDGLDDAPDLSCARLAGPIRGLVDMHSIRRPPSHPGLALVGDAAQTNDPMWGVGIGLAFQTAEMLADAVGPVMGSSDRHLDRALRSYGRQHRRLLLGHHLLMRDHATGRPFRRLERLLFSTAPHHPPTAALLSEIAARNRPIHRIVTPPRLARTMIAAATRKGDGGNACERSRGRNDHRN